MCENFIFVTVQRVYREGQNEKRPRKKKSAKVLEKIKEKENGKSETRRQNFRALTSTCSAVVVVVAVFVFDLTRGRCLSPTSRRAPRRRLFSQTVFCPLSDISFSILLAPFPRSILSLSLFFLPPTVPGVTKDALASRGGDPD